MRQLFTLSFATLVALSLNAQSLTSPESVEYDPAYNRYLVSNSGDGTIVARDQAGVITSFATGIPSGPYGLEILENTLYACAGGRVRGFDLATGAEVFNVNTGGTFLNGIATDGMFIYVTDFNGDKIFKVDVDAATSSTLVANTNGTPNGIVHDPDTDLLWVAFWGANAPVKAYELDGTPGQTFATTLSNIDGITRDCFGNLYLASWTPDAITRLEIASGTQTNMGWTVANPADIDFDAVNSLICIPNTSTSTVTLETVDDCITGVADLSAIGGLTISPNPTTNTIQIANTTNARTYRIMDSASRVVLSGKIPSNATIDVSGLSPGVYMLALDKTAQFSRFVRAQ
ncbi:MAG: T9SS type A sorting domain-containing protein [Flavobacteriales bacterium]|nr:T9SS type A sorting domain-containing protein [Flavobacteriales bacterium]MBK9535937.1 T9SS type A sorting domain-containing protein [Flavobacteriales bacterium]MBP9138884.1 T9SS type A sorting domain-containing protein [Flavobacteriales bacterium]HQV51754.1 T9SS type A sorting domain-containing protein [Flavobacteriales bacterium]HQX29092.1 T9SS type A sorting domain-containing protein [Flavobacteriales bacterium]